MSDREKLIRYELISMIITVIGFILMFAASDHPVLSLLGGAAAIGGLILYYKTRKCPHCGVSLFGVRFLPDHCPHCGKEIL